jgi:hypothetical protein
MSGRLIENNIRRTLHRGLITNDGMMTAELGRKIKQLQMVHTFITMMIRRNQTHIPQ